MTAEAFIAEIPGKRRKRFQVFRLDDGAWMLAIDEYDETGSAAPILDSISPRLADLLEEAAPHASEPLVWRRAGRGEPVDLAELATGEQGV